jgi:hypothetical protein
VLIQRVHVLQLSFDKFQADEQGWVDTIKSVNSGGTVRINTMDWLGQSQYAPQTVFWPSLSSAISEVFKLALMFVFSGKHLDNWLLVSLSLRIFSL